MSDGMIVVDPHAFDSLWPALGVWLLLFLTAGDAQVVLPRAYAMAAGRPAQAVILDKRREPVRMLGSTRRDFVYFSAEGADGKQREPVSASGYKRLAAGQRVPAHLLGRRAFLDDDFGYARFKLWLFGVSFVALWAWAALRYRFG